MDPKYTCYYRRLYEEHWWWRARESFILDRLRAIYGARDIGPILDVGCGDGLFFEKLRSFGTPEGIEMAPAAVTGDAAAGSIRIGPFDESFKPGKTYELILMLDVIEHVCDDVAFLKRAVDLLSPDGRILITVPAFPWLWTHHDDVNQHYRRYTRKGLEALARVAGLTIEDSHYLFLWTVLAKLLVQAKELLVAPKSDLPTIPPKPLNAALIALSRLEYATIGMLRPPLGSSLLAVAKKVSGCASAA